ncbi:hypothetical protein PENTCL1PPCAC_29263, partial [Pristionchus entomophagus]
EGLDLLGLFHLLLQRGDADLLDSEVGDRLGVGERESDERLGTHGSLLGSGNGEAIGDLGVEVETVLEASLERASLVEGLVIDVGVPSEGISGREGRSYQSCN